MKVSFEHAEVFPVIARIIRQKYQQVGRFVTHQEIASALLEDDEATTLIERAYREQEGQQSREWLASNMVAWFSQRITTGQSQWGDTFQREEVNGQWAYKPVETDKS